MPLKPEDLIKVWDAPDNTRLTPKQISIRLPILVSARIAALCDLFPRKTKTEIIGDLLATALDQLEKGLPARSGDPADYDQETGVISYVAEGLRGEFHKRTIKHLRALETEAGITEPMQIPAPEVSDAD